MSAPPKRRRDRKAAAATAAPPAVAEKSGRFDGVLISLLVLVGAVQFITMPSMYYPGDNFAPRIECSGWVATGTLGIDYSVRPEFGGFVEKRGQYLYENDGRGRFFSKYGFGNTLAYVPAYWAEKLRTGKLALMAGTDSLLFAINVEQVLLSLLFAFYLYRLAMLFAGRRWMAAVFVGVSIYSTYAWHYLRSPTLEIFQMPAFVGACFHALLFMRRREAGDDSARTWWHLTAAVCWSGWLVMTKVFFVVCFVPLWAFALVSGEKGLPWTARLAANFRKRLVPGLLSLVLPSLLWAVFLMWSNWYRFGSPFDTGYFQWVDDQGGYPGRLELRTLPIALKGLFVRVEQYNAFVVYPVFLFALAGIPTFFRKFRTEAVFLAGMFLVNLIPAACYITWNGSWCYGPRYQLHILVIGSVAFLEVMAWLRRHIREFPVAAAAAAMAAILAFSFHLQVQVNSLHYFTYNYVHGLFSQFKTPGMQKICDGMIHSRHRGFTHGDLKAYIEGRRSYEPVEEIRRVVRPDQAGAVMGQVDSHLRQMARPNYYFFD